MIPSVIQQPLIPTPSSLPEEGCSLNTHLGGTQVAAGQREMPAAAAACAAVGTSLAGAILLEGPHLRWACRSPQPPSAHHRRQAPYFSFIFCTTTELMRTIAAWCDMDCTEHLCYAGSKVCARAARVTHMGITHAQDDTSPGPTSSSTYSRGRKNAADRDVRRAAGARAGHAGY